MDWVLPFGLLVSELISNAFRHGFVDGCSGDLNITQAPLDRHARWRLCVSDTSAGRQAACEARRGRSPGLQLARDGAVPAGGVFDIGPVLRVVFAVDFTPAAARAEPAGVSRAVALVVRPPALPPGMA